MKRFRIAAIRVGKPPTAISKQVFLGWLSTSTYTLLPTHNLTQPIHNLTQPYLKRFTKLSYLKRFTKFIFAPSLVSCTELLLRPQTVCCTILGNRRRFLRAQFGRRLSRRRPDFDFLHRRDGKKSQSLQIRHRLDRLPNSYHDHIGASFLRLPRRRSPTESSTSATSASPTPFSTSGRVHRLCQHVHHRLRSTHLLRRWRGSPPS